MPYRTEARKLPVNTNFARNETLSLARVDRVHKTSGPLEVTLIGKLYGQSTDRSRHIWLEKHQKAFLRGITPKGIPH